MDAETQTKIDEIWAILRAMADRETEIDRRSELAHRRAMERMDKMEHEHRLALERMDKIEREHRLAHQEAMARMDRHERSLDRHERSLEGIRKLLLAGGKMMVKMQAETRDLKKAQKAFFESFRNGRGNGRRHTG